MAKIIGHNAQGNPIGDDGEVIAATKTPTKYTAGTFLDNAFEQAKPYLPALSSMEGTDLGAGVGSAFGPVGTVAGGALGGILSYLLAKKGTDALKGPTSALPNQDDLMEAGKNQAFNSGMPLAMKGATKAINALGDSPLLRTILHLAPQQNIPEDAAAIKATPQLDRSLGEYTGSSKLQNLETKLGKQPLVDLRNSQRAQQVEEINNFFQKLGGKGNPPSTSPAPQPDLSATTGSQGQQAFQDAYLSSKGKYQGLYNQFQKNIIEPNTREIQTVTGYEPDSSYGILDANGQPLPPTKGAPIIENRTVELPIHLGGTSYYAQQTGADLSKLLSPDHFENLPQRLQTAYKQVGSLLEDAAKPTEIVAADGSIQSLPFKNYEAVKEARTGLSRLIDNSKGREKAMLTGLSQALDKDISSTLNSVDPAGGAENLRQQANEAFAKHQDTYKSLLNRVYGNDKTLSNFTDPQNMFKAADTDPVVARKLRAAFRGEDLPVLKTGMLSQSFDNAYDPVSKTLNVDAMLAKITAPDSPYRSILTPGELNSTEEILRGMRTQNPNAMQSGKSLGFYGGKIALTAGGGTVGALLGHNTMERTAGGIGGAVTALILPSVFVNKVLLNPNYARVAANLSKVPAASPEAQLMVKTLLKGALKGAQISLSAPDGTEQDVTVGKD